jgi:hypothetical protein
MADIKQLVIEYILTNGTLPGFQQRLESSKPFWKTATEPFTVYRGQGHKKPGIPRPEEVNPDTIIINLRPILSTSKNINSVLEFTDKQGCCIHKITVEPGTLFLDFTEFTDITENDIKNFMIMKKNEENGEIKGIYPYNNLPRSAIFNDFKKRHAREEEVLLSTDNATLVRMGEYTNTFTFVTNETKRKKIKDYKTILMRVIKKSYGPKVGGLRANQKTRKTRKRARRRSQRSKTIQRKFIR